MAHFIDSLSILEQSRDVNDILLLSHLFKSHSMRFVSDTNVIFNDLNGKEREPELVSSENEALQLIASWPSLGGTEYSYRNHMLSFFLYGTEDHRIDVITTSISTSAYVLQPELKSEYDALITAIHGLFAAVRTIADYELLSPDSFWKDELARVRSNTFLGTYMIDLR